MTALVLVLVIVGAACLAYAGYQLIGTNIAAHHAYDRERTAIKKDWNDQSKKGAGHAVRQPAPGRAANAHQPSGHTRTRGAAEDHEHQAPVPGDAIGLISIPSIGVSQIPILQGVSPDVLARGVGHYPGTAAPGGVGNFAVAGHRITHGQPFANLLQLNPGDRIVVETRTQVFTYLVQVPPRSLTVENTDSWVIDSVPGHPQQRPSQRLITLTTCQDLFHSPDRSVGFGRLVLVRNK